MRGKRFDNGSSARVGKNIRRARKEARITMIEVADHLGMTNAQMSFYERGVSCISVDVLVAIAACLGVTPANLLDDEFAPPAWSPPIADGASLHRLKTGTIVQAARLSRRREINRRML